MARSGIVSPLKRLNGRACWFTLLAVERYPDYEAFSARAGRHLVKGTLGLSSTGVVRADQRRS